MQARVSSRTSAQAGSAKARAYVGKGSVIIEQIRLIKLEDVIDLDDPDASDAYCGDGIVDSGEECDDGNDSELDCCTTSCTANPVVCGDGYKCGAEACDDGNTDDGDCCSADCSTVSICLSE